MRKLRLLLVAGLVLGGIVLAGWIGLRLVLSGRLGGASARPISDEPSPEPAARPSSAGGTSNKPSGDGPLGPTLAWAREMKQSVQKNIRDYSAVFVKREADGGKIQERTMFLKVRNEPFSVYLYYLEPEDRRGREAIYVEGQNNGNMFGHETGWKRKLTGTVSLSPTNYFMMDGRRPITEIGILNLCNRLIQFGEKERGNPETLACRFPNVRINGRPCTCIQVVHPKPSPDVYYHLLRIYADDQLKAPVRFDAYDWPKQPGEEPPLIEGYTYLDIKVNQGFTDEDFNPKNPKYSFP
jgi:hypothetical protein